MGKVTEEQRRPFKRDVPHSEGADRRLSASEYNADLQEISGLFDDLVLLAR
jgi:hypothetical protein